MDSPNTRFLGDELNAELGIPPPTYQESYNGEKTENKAEETQKSAHVSRPSPGAPLGYHAYLSYLIQIRRVPRRRIVAQLGMADDLIPIHNSTIPWVLKSFHGLNDCERFDLLLRLEEWSSDHILCAKHLVFHSKDNICDVTQPEESKSFLEFVLIDPIKAWHILRRSLHADKYGPWPGITDKTLPEPLKTEHPNWKLLIWAFPSSLLTCKPQNGASIGQARDTLGNDQQGKPSESDSMKFYNSQGVYTLAHGIHQCDIGSGCDHSWATIHSESHLVCRHVLLWDRDLPNDMGPQISLPRAVHSHAPGSVLTNSTARNLVWSPKTRTCLTCRSRYDWLVQVVGGKRWVYFRRLTPWGMCTNPWGSWSSITDMQARPPELEKRRDVWFHGWCLRRGINSECKSLRKKVGIEARAHEHSITSTFMAQNLSPVTYILLRKYDWVVRSERY